LPRFLKPAFLTGRGVIDFDFVEIRFVPVLLTPDCPPSADKTSGKSLGHGE